MTTYAFDDIFRRHVAAQCAKFQPLDAPAETPLKRAAVALVIIQADDAAKGAAILLTRRAKGLRSHGGQWALPGGRCEPSETPIDAALRELDEELGLRLYERDVLGVLDDYPTRSGYLITPMIAWAGVAAAIRPNLHEVASVHRIPIEDLADADAVSFISIPESDRPVIRLHVEGRFVHAPTAAVIYQFLEVLAGRQTRVIDFEQPVFAWK